MHEPTYSTYSEDLNSSGEQRFHLIDGERVRIGWTRLLHDLPNVSVCESVVSEPNKLLNKRLQGRYKLSVNVELFRVGLSCVQGEAIDEGRTLEPFSKPVGMEEIEVFTNRRQPSVETKTPGVLVIGATQVEVRQLEVRPQR